MKNKKIILTTSITLILIIVIVILLFLLNRNNIGNKNNLESQALLENEIIENYESIENIIDDDNKINIENEVKEENLDNQVISFENNTNTEISSNTNNQINKNNSNKENIVYPVYKKLLYGSSENGRDLVYYSIAPDNYTSTLLMVFAIHGYEDGYAKDGQLLVDVAEYLREYYQNKSQEKMYSTRILIVPSANPDGLYEGTTNNGFGRCNAKGIDLNRDFDALHKVFNGVRNYTQYPFSAKESQALRDLINTEKPDAVIDFHGWENCTIGDKVLADVFKNYVSLKHKTEFNSNCNGYLSYWAHLQGCASLLVEFTNTSIPKENVAKAIDKILEII